MASRKNRRYTLDFKEQAVDLASRVGFPAAGSQLGVNPNNIHRWSKELGNPRVESSNSKPNLEEENRRLQKENEELKKVNHILKRAAAFFSQDHLK